MLHVESPSRREICMAQSPGKLQLQFCLTRCRITELWGMKLTFFFVAVYHCKVSLLLFKNESKKWNRRKMKANVTWVPSVSLFRKKACLEVGPSMVHLFSSLGYLRKRRRQNLDSIKSKLKGANQKRKQINKKGYLFTRQNQLLSWVPCGNSSWMASAKASVICALWCSWAHRLGPHLLEWLFRCFPF